MTAQKAIEIEGLSKRYRLGVIGRRTLQEDLSRRWALLRGRPDPGRIVGDRRQGSGGDYIWALKDVDLDVEVGTVVGVIGGNGAGKSTLLKILSRITAPSHGLVTVRGRVGSLLEVGTGFHPELTGKENIYLNGAILGMTKAEIRSRFDAIVDFSGVGAFLETPVKRYSSGMRVRLAFAVAAHLEPEIMLIDEVLSVGDAAFQKRCLGKMEEVARGGRTILFVSHQMAAVRSFCERVVHLREGHLVADGAADEVIQGYLASGPSSTGTTSVDLRSATRESGNGRLRFLDWRVRDQVFGDGTRVRSCQECEVRLGFECSPDANDVRGVSVAVTVSDALGQPICTGWTKFRDLDYDEVPRRGTFVCKFGELPLAAGVYRVSLWSSAAGEVLDYIPNAGSFEVTPTDAFGTGRVPISRHHGSVILRDQDWSLEVDEGDHGDQFTW